MEPLVDKIILPVLLLQPLTVLLDMLLFYEFIKPKNKNEKFLQERNSWNSFSTRSGSVAKSVKQGDAQPQRLKYFNLVSDLSIVSSRIVSSANLENGDDSNT
ncbi:hypothetical protein HI914_00072 [Erysiphe necator]|nr:hypothetical protein HI914_00072 [Erysiphe necator]